MQTPPDHVCPQELLAHVRRNYELPNTFPKGPLFQPLGEDSWNYRYGDFWFSLRQDLRGSDTRCYDALPEIAMHSNAAVIAPISDRSGSVVNEFQGLPLLVFPFVEHTTFVDHTPTPHQREQIVALLNDLHRTPPNEGLAVEDFALDFHGDLEHALNWSDGAFIDTGPLSRQAYEMLFAARHQLESWIEEHRTLAEACRNQDTTTVLTHGEPLPANILRLGDGTLALIDFTEMKLGPPERDWIHLERCFSIAMPMRPDFRDFYRLRWRLSEIAEYSSVLTAEHVGTPEQKVMLQRLGAFLTREGAP